MEFFLIYLFVMVERIGSMLMFGWGAFWIGILLLAATAFTCMMTASEYSERRDFSTIWKDSTATLFKRISKYLIPIGFIVGTLGFLTPTQKDLAIIVGSGVTYNVLTSEPAKRIGSKAVELLEQKIEDALKKEEPNPEAEQKK